ncbi:MAG: hypothetical protein H6602_05990 [Flavobacteriales bacterium]|nr:hypothetical protein [Flavobacteriales bacterium]
MNQKRLLFFVHDGTGLGHLRRVSKIARKLQGLCSCLVVSGHRSAAWIVPEECEYVHLPSLDSLFKYKAQYWNREPFLKVDKKEALEMRGVLLKSVFKAFNPDAIFVDFLPLGKNKELWEFINTTNSRKYFIMRGVMDHPSRVKDDVLREEGEKVLVENYDRILVTSDLRIVDVANEYGLDHRIVQKLIYTGYVSERLSQSTRLQVRKNRGIGLDEQWVVCSVGGGILGEKVVAKCIQIASQLPAIRFDIVAGPKSSLDTERLGQMEHPLSNVRVAKSVNDLALWHGSADVVVCAGGYNSIVESLEGSAHVLCFPTQLETNDEQFIHPRRLSGFAPVSLVSDLNELYDNIIWALTKKSFGFGHARVNLDFNGLDKIKEIVYSDFNLSGN